MSDIIQLLQRLGGKNYWFRYVLRSFFSTRAYVSPTDADYEAMEKVKKKLENLQNLKMLSHLLALKTLQYNKWNHFQYVFPICTWRKANAIHKFSLTKRKME